jgi:hypothetical protein
VQAPAWRLASAFGAGNSRDNALRHPAARIFPPWSDSKRIHVEPAWAAGGDDPACAAQTLTGGKRRSPCVSTSAHAKDKPMAISTEQLEQLASKLHALKTRLAQRKHAPDAAISMDDPVVDMARACEFPLPATMTARTLEDEVDRKIANVAVLMERARQHEALPPDIRAAADQENTLMVEDYRADKASEDGRR